MKNVKKTELVMYSSFTNVNITTEELFANDHIKSNIELIKDIDFYINTVKNDNKTLGKIYRIVKTLVEEV